MKHNFAWRNVTTFNHIFRNIVVCWFILATYFLSNKNKTRSSRTIFLFIFRLVFLSAFIAFSGAFAAIIILDKELQQSFLKISFLVWQLDSFGLF